MGFKVFVFADSRSFDIVFEESNLSSSRILKCSRWRTRWMFKFKYIGTEQSKLLFKAQKCIKQAGHDLAIIVRSSYNSYF